MHGDGAHCSDLRLMVHRVRIPCRMTDKDPTLTTARVSWSHRVCLSRPCFVDTRGRVIVLGSELFVRGGKLLGSRRVLNDIRGAFTSSLLHFLSEIRDTIWIESAETSTADCSASANKAHPCFVPHTKACTPINALARPAVVVFRNTKQF